MTIETLLSNFNTDSASKWLGETFKGFDASFAKAIPAEGDKNEKETFKSVTRLGIVTKLPGNDQLNHPMPVFAIAMKREITERSSRVIQFSLAKRLLRETVLRDAAQLDGIPSQGLFFFFDDNGAFRLSLVTGIIENRSFKYNSFKRQSFFSTPGGRNSIFNRRLSKTFSTFDDIKNAFSVEALTKEFYTELFDWYQWAMDEKTGVQFPNDPGTPKDNRLKLSEAVIRLLTRLMFVWFIKQKNIVPSALFDMHELSKILVDFKPESMTRDNYYRAVLQNLFFATLNCDPKKRRFVKIFQGKSEQMNVKTFYRYENELADSNEFKDLMKRIPFLNCALFDCLDRPADPKHGLDHDMLIDGFSSKPKRRAHLPNALFFKTKDTTARGGGEGIIHIFSRFEFTVDENSFDDFDVALDPELLGKVFENLLGAFNPETQVTARNATGSFYTPREIVDYMVEESMKHYLKGKVSTADDARLNDLFDKTLCAEKAKHKFDDDEAKQLLAALYDCRILDPACGSGAFPMGILHCMVRLFARLDPNGLEQGKRLLARYKEDVANEPTGLSAKEREKRCDELKAWLKENQSHPDYARKLYIIENCIYGVDIQPIAAQISKLRFFISLLCDQLRRNWNPGDGNFGLLSLPNLETKFVCANTLIPLPQAENGEFVDFASEEITKLKNRLNQNRRDIYKARTTEQKEKCRERDYETRDEITDVVRSAMSKVNEEKIARLRNDLVKLETEFASCADKKVELVKVIVGEDLFNAGHEEWREIDVNAKKRKELQLQIKWISSEIEKAQRIGMDTTAEEVARRVAAWNPYDQNACADFFDSEWMFNITNGFDIVIGNPPYGAHLDDSTRAQVNEFYMTARTRNGQRGSTDTYSLFTERGYNLACQGGTVAFIIPMSFTSSDSMSQLHNLLYNNCAKMKVSSYAVRPQQIFLDATVNTCILIFTRTNSPCETLLTSKMYRKGNNFNLENMLQSLEFVNCKPYAQYGRIPKIGTTIETRILDKIRKLTPIASLIRSNGALIYYRTSGGRYFKVVTNYSTGSTKETSLCIEKKYSDVTGCCLSSNLAFWFYQIVSNNLDWKSSEIESFTIPIDKLDDAMIKRIVELYERYLKDIESNANIRTSSKKSSYKVESFKEYKIGKSKKIIDEIDDLIGPLYGLTEEEINFVKNYEIIFRLSEEIDLVEGRGGAVDKQSVAPVAQPVSVKPSSSRVKSVRDDDVDEE